MRVKKFSCDQCGAPKVNPYSNPYVVCDYCGNMIDIDYTAGLQVWNHSEEHTRQYMWMKQTFENNLANYLKQGNQEKYRKEQYDYWDYYYKHYPEYLPPSIPKGEKYDLYIKAAADMTTDGAFNPPPATKSDAYNAAYAGLEYYQKNGQSFVTYASFIKMIRAYMELQTQSFRIVYDNPAYSIMNEVLPEKFRAKMSLSQISQVWVPYLEEEQVDDFLEEFQLKHEYVEMEEPQRINVVCEDCKKDLAVPAGALVCICEHCRHENILKKTVHCHNCGIENTLPEQWNVMIDCKSCGTELRVVQPLFG